MEYVSPNTVANVTEDRNPQSSSFPTTQAKVLQLPVQTLIWVSPEESHKEAVTVKPVPTI